MDIDVIRTVEYPGSIDHFKAFIEQFEAQHRRLWTLENSSYHFWPERGDNIPKHRAAWEFIERISTEPGSNTYWGAKAGIIYALETIPNRTKVQFIDGVNLIGFFRNSKESKKMGRDFVIIAEELISQIQNTSSLSGDLSEPITQSLEDWFDYLHAVKHRIRIKLDYIAKQTGYEYSYVRKMHSLYLKEHEIPKKVKVTKSNKK